MKISKSIIPLAVMIPGLALAAPTTLTLVNKTQCKVGTATPYKCVPGTGFSVNVANDITPQTYKTVKVNQAVTIKYNKNYLIQPTGKPNLTMLEDNTSATGTGYIYNMNPGIDVTPHDPTANR